MSLRKVKPEDYTSLPQERKAEYCLKWKYEGISVKELSKFFQVSERTIYLWLKQARQSVLEELEEQRPIDVLIEHMCSIQRYMDMCLYQASQHSDERSEYDPTKDEIRKKSPDAKAFNESMRTLHQFQKTLIDLQQSVGVLPKKAEQIYHVISDNKDRGNEEGQILTLEEQKLRVIEQLQSIKILSNHGKQPESVSRGSE